MLRKYIKNDKTLNLAEWALAIISAVIISLFVRQFIFTTAVVSGPSMAPTLNNGDRVIINRIAMRLESPVYGDIVAFPYPANPDDKHIKRVIGLPGDYIDVYDNRIFINGELFLDGFSLDGVFLSGDMTFPLIVGEDEYFMLGDNRSNSKDSRFASVGLIKRENMIGRAWLRFIPLNSIGIVR
ncbi:MAG: signal peptidase I [Defluviitaleaceae bacterium]|nr:signal peptidase I [Defluviitaleaceae bacterium]